MSQLRSQLCGDLEEESHKQAGSYSKEEESLLKHDGGCDHKSKPIIAQKSHDIQQSRIPVQTTTAIRLRTEDTRSIIRRFKSTPEVNAMTLSVALWL